MADINTDFGKSSDGLMYKADTTMVTIGSHANGETGLNICINGLIALCTDLDSPLAMPKGIAIMVARIKPKATVVSDVHT